MYATLFEFLEPQGPYWLLRSWHVHGKPFAYPSVIIGIVSVRTLPTGRRWRASLQLILGLCRSADMNPPIRCLSDSACFGAVRQFATSRMWTKSFTGNSTRPKQLGNASKKRQREICALENTRSLGCSWGQSKTGGNLCGVETMPCKLIRDDQRISNGWCW